MSREMVIAAQNGHGDSIAELIKSVQNDAYRVAFSYLKNEHDSMDAVCTGVEKALRSIKQLKEPEYFKTWFIRIVINESKKILKKKQKESLVFGNQVELEVEGHSESVETKHDINKAMESLSDELRLIVGLKYYLNLTFSEIAQVIMMPESTVKSKLYKALRILKKQLK